LSFNGIFVKRNMSMKKHKGYISEQKKFLIQNYLEKQPVSRAYLFGSYSRGDNTAESDIDILVELEKGVGLFRFADIQIQLQQLLNQQVDLVSAGGLSPYIEKHINKDKILIYERKN